MAAPQLVTSSVKQGLCIIKRYIQPGVRFQQGPWRVPEYRHRTISRFWLSPDIVLLRYMLGQVSLTCINHSHEVSRPTSHPGHFGPYAGGLSMSSRSYRHVGTRNMCESRKAAGKPIPSIKCCTREPIRISHSIHQPRVLEYFPTTVLRYLGSLDLTKFRTGSPRLQSITVISLQCHPARWGVVPSTTSSNMPAMHSRAIPILPHSTSVTFHILHFSLAVGRFGWQLHCTAAPCQGQCCVRCAAFTY